MASETLYQFIDGAGVCMGVGTETEARDLIAAGVLPADLKLTLVGTFKAAS